MAVEPYYVIWCLDTLKLHRIVWCLFLSCLFPGSGMQVTRPPTGGHLTTYARKKGRSRVLQTSSPARATNGEDISVIEMAHRMQKRAWQSMNSAWPALERDLTNQEKNSKRPKNTHAVVSTFSSDSDGTRPSPVFPIDSLTDETNNVQYKTPFNLSPVSSPTTPDSMSPVPPSRRHISGTASRNLKENRSDIRLASPFHSCSVSKACSRSGSRTNSPRKMIKKPPFYIKARTRSETNAHPGENMADEVPFPGSGSLPTLGSMKASVCDRHPADGSTVYMLQNLSKQDWFTPAKALSRSSFPEDYIPPGTPFQEWDYSAEPFLGGIPLQTSTPNVVKDVVRRHISADAAPNPPPSRALDGVNHNTKNSFDVRDPEHGRRYQRHSNHDSIFSSSFDASKTFCTSIIRPNCMNTERFPQDDSALLTAYSSDPGKAVINLSGMLDCLDIDGMSHSRIGGSVKSPLRRVVPRSMQIVQLCSSRYPDPLLPNHCQRELMSCI